MHDFISIGDTVRDIYLEMDPENAHLYKVRHEECQLCFNYADKIPVRSKHDLIGGNAANVAVAMARLGFDTGIYTHVGDDSTGERIVRELGENQVNLRYVHVDRHSESNYNTVINLNGERTILVYHIDRKYVLPRLNASKWLYLTSMKGSFEHILPDIVDYVRDHKTKLVYQPGTFQLKYGAKKTARLLKHTYAIMVNREEAEHYLDLPNAGMRQLLDSLLALGPEVALITDGQKGAFVTDGFEYLHLGVLEDIPRIEVTGAGDSFDAGFVAALAAGNSLGEALRWGQCEASSVIQHIGAQEGLLYKKQLEQMLGSYPDLQPTPIK